MGLDIYFPEDIRNALLAANEASSATAGAAISQNVQTLDMIAEKLQEKLPEDTSRVLLDALHAAAVGNMDTLKHYRQGYRAALVTVALAFGLPPTVIAMIRGRPMEATLLAPVETQRGPGIEETKAAR